MAEQKIQDNKLVRQPSSLNPEENSTRVKSQAKISGHSFKLKKSPKSFQQLIEKSARLSKGQGNTKSM